MKITRKRCEARAGAYDEYIAIRRDTAIEDATDTEQHAMVCRVLELGHERVPEQRVDLVSEVGRIGSVVMNGDWHPPEYRSARQPLDESPMKPDDRASTPETLQEEETRPDREKWSAVKRRPI